jgi:hypothetical protein
MLHLDFMNSMAKLKIGNSLLVISSMQMRRRAKGEKERNKEKLYYKYKIYLQSLIQALSIHRKFNKEYNNLYSPQRRKYLS